MTARWLRVIIYVLFSTSLITALGLTSYYFFGKRILGENGNFNFLSGPCKNSNLSTGPTKGNYEFHTEKLDFINVNMCFLGFVGIKDNVFPDNSLRFKIGFYDDMGKLHIYPARIGGVDDGGRVVKPSLCQPKNSESVECRLVNLKEIQAVMKENTIWEAQIIYRDDFSWPAALQLKENAEIIMSIKEAIRKGTGFPELPKDSNFVLQVWSLFKLE